MNSEEVKSLLINQNYIYENDVFIVSPEGLKESTKWGEFQYNILKPVAQFNQKGKCICGKPLFNSQLHHAILSRNDVKGCKGFAKVGIHHTLNSIEVCEKCNPHPIREKCIIYLASLYGKKRIIDWYNNYPMRTKTFRIEYFLE